MLPTQPIAKNKLVYEWLLHLVFVIANTFGPRGRGFKDTNNNNDNRIMLGHFMH